MCVVEYNVQRHWLVLRNPCYSILRSYDEIQILPAEVSHVPHDP